MLNLFNFFKKEPTKVTLHYVSNIDAYSSLPRGTRKTLEILWAYEFPPALIKKLKEKFPFNAMTDSEIAICIDEFKKFMAVMIIGKKKKKGVAMTSNVIDTIWHQFILFTIEYEQFSELLNGKFIHHTPNTEAFSFGADAAMFFYSTYKKYLGDLHPIWLHTIVEDGTHEVNYSTQSLLQVLSASRGDVDDKNFAYTKKYQLSKKANLHNGSVGIAKDAIGSSSKGRCGGIFCGGYATGYTAADGSGVADFGGCGGGASCGGCGGCGG